MTQLSLQGQSLGYLGLDGNTAADRSIAGAEFLRTPGKGLFLCKPAGVQPAPWDTGHRVSSSAQAKLALLWSKGLPTITSFGSWCTAQPSMAADVLPSPWVSGLPVVPALSCEFTEQ